MENTQQLVPRTWGQMTSFFHLVSWPRLSSTNSSLLTVRVTLFQPGIPVILLQEWAPERKELVLTPLRGCALRRHETPCGSMRKASRAPHPTICKVKEKRFPFPFYSWLLHLTRNIPCPGNSSLPNINNLYPHCLSSTSGRIFNTSVSTSWLWNSLWGLGYKT